MTGTAYDDAVYFLFGDQLFQPLEVLFLETRRIVSTPCAVMSKASLQATPMVLEPTSNPKIRMFLL